ncbi:MAG: hypothetical protein ACOYB1_09940 [Limnohabitans sp.]
MNNSVKIKVTLVSRTDLAILVSDGHRDVWVPLSQVEEEIEEPTGPMNIMGTVAILVKDWVAQEKGLQASIEDDQTMDLFGSRT